MSWNHLTMGFGAPKVLQVRVTVLPSTDRALGAGPIVISGGRAESRKQVPGVRIVAVLYGYSLLKVVLGFISFLLSG